MAPLTLYHFLVSPPSRAALLVVRNLDLDVEVNIVNLFAGEHMGEDFLKINPEHTVPTLVDEDYILWESKAIAGYLVEQYKPDCALYPVDPKKRGIINQRLYFDACTLFTTVREAVLPVMRHGATVIEQDKKDNIGKALEKMETYLEGNDWVAGDDCTIADLCLLATVASIRAADLVDLGEYANVSGWYERCGSLPGYDENEEGAVTFGNFIKSKVEES